MDIENVVYVYKHTHTEDYYPALKKNKMLFAWKCVELEITMLREISQTEKQIPHLLSHMWNLD
jgi:hypothetical protein